MLGHLQYKLIPHSDTIFKKVLHFNLYLKALSVWLK